MIGGLTVQCSPNCSLELWRIVGDKVGQRAELGMAPTRFHRIELGSVGRQPFELDVPNSRSGNPSGSRTMHLPPIPANQQRSPEFSPQLAEERQHFARANRIFVNLKWRADATTCRRERHGSDHTQAIVAIPCPLHGCLARRSPGAPIHRLQAKAGFIDESDDCPAADAAWRPKRPRDRSSTRPSSV